MENHDKMGRFSVQFVAANFRDVARLAPGEPVLENVEHMTVAGVVDSGTARLVLPNHVVDRLQLTIDGEVNVRYADHRQEKRPRVSGVWIEMNGRNGVFSAIAEPGRSDALIGAIVLEELDLMVDCVTHSLYPRDPHNIVAEIE